jgi:fatty acid-binding protein DegV
MSTWHKVEIITTEDGKGDLKQTVEGNSKAVAAWMRAVADELDPKRPVLRDVRGTQKDGGRG